MPRGDRLRQLQAGRALEVAQMHLFTKVGRLHLKKDRVRRQGIPVVADDIRDPHYVHIDFDLAQKCETRSAALHRRGGLVTSGPVLHAIAVDQCAEEA